jgi:hypothetical protein
MLSLIIIIIIIIIKVKITKFDYVCTMSPRDRGAAQSQVTRPPSGSTRRQLSQGRILAGLRVPQGSLHAGG